ncbi:hypothetical protein [Sphingomonas sp. URHD0057]|uniref:hypothetical protein n=1 Tax=Sphingomonas sp. URHD0057 TaxID=1380389 RepID=UPI0012DDAA9C|nr:hypothetical protein [Sphingomonas sp. URHD0057]
MIGNLGVDLLVIPAAAAFGLEAGSKLIVILIAPLTVLGIFWTAREVHGRVPPTTLFAVPFVYGLPFNYGFVNFSLSMALALLAFALWLRLERTSAARPRAALFVPISCLVWLAHAFGWGVLALMVWSSELVRLRDQGRTWLNAAGGASISSLPLGVPLLLMIAWRAGHAGAITTGFFNLHWKVFYLIASLEDRWLLIDAVSVAAVIVLISAAIFDRQLQLSRRLAIPASVLLIIFLLLPVRMFGSVYADARLAPFILILAVVAVRFRDRTPSRTQNRLALVACLFVGFRLIANTVSFAMADAEWGRQLRALDHIPEGARVLSLVGLSCDAVWPLPRHSQLGAFVIFRKNGFANEQWQIPGAQLIRVHDPEAEPFLIEPSEATYAESCVLRARELQNGPKLRTADQALEQFPRHAFDFVWLVEPNGFTDRPRQGLKLLWADEDSRLYRVTGG